MYTYASTAKVQKKYEKNKYIMLILIKIKKVMSFMTPLKLS